MRHVLVTLALATTLAGCAVEPGGSPAAAVPTVDVPALERAGWVAMESVCGFRLEHPPAWEVVGSDTFGFFVVHPIVGEGGVMITALPGGFAATLGSMSVGDTFEAGRTTSTIVATGSQRFLGQDATRLEIMDDGTGTRFTSYAVEIEGGALLVSMREGGDSIEREVIATMATNGAVDRPCRAWPSEEIAFPEDAPWRTYASGAGWLVSHPPNWGEIPMSSSGEALLLMPPRVDDGVSDSLMVVVRPNDGMTIEAFVDEYVAALEAKYPDFELESLEFEERRGADAARIGSWESHNFGPRWFSRVVLVRPDSIVLFEGEFGARESPFLPVADEIVDTFRFEAAQPA